MTDRIDLTGIEVMARHGVLPAEKTTSQKFLVDLSIVFDTLAAAASDNLDDTVDYGVLAERVHAVVESESHRLIETLADRIARAVLEEPLVSRVQVTVHKPQAPITVPFKDVSVTIERGR